MKETEFGAIMTVDDIKRKLAKMYDKVDNGYSMKRDLFIHKSYCNYGELGAVFFALNGSPPKGYAIYVPDHSYVLFVDAWGEHRERRHVIKLEGLDELPDDIILKNKEDE